MRSWGVTAERTTYHDWFSPSLGQQLQFCVPDCMPDEARDGRNVALNYQVNCWCARSSKGTILYYLHT